MNHLFRVLALQSLAVTLLAFSTSCQSTIPTAADLDHYYQQATDIANRQIAILDGQLARGEISQSQHDTTAAAIRANIPKQAGDLAWARHELAESQKRALGIPTGDHAVQVNAPGAGGNNSFYQPRGQVGSGFGRSSDLGGMSGIQQPTQRGETQGMMGVMQGPVTSDDF